MPEIGGGGVEKNLFLVSKHLASKIENTYLITASKNYKNYFQKKIKIILPKSSFWNTKTRKIKYLICIYLLIKKIIFNKNFVIFAFQANLYCILIAKIFRVKIIVRSNSSPEGWSKNIFKNLIFKILLKKADAIIVNSLDFKKQLYHKFSVNSECIYNPVNTIEIINSSQKKIKNIDFKNKNKEHIKIINVGRFVDQKDQITLLKSLNLLKKQLNFQAILLGQGILYSDMRKYIKKNKLEKIIKLRKFEKNPYPLIQQSDLFILTSKFEGLPNVLLEAVVLKKPIISSECPTGPREILDSGKGGHLFKIGDYKALSKIILKYNTDKKSFKIKSQFAFNRLSRFDFDKNMNKYYLLINSYL